MALTPITSLTLASGAAQNVTVVDQNGNPLPDSSITWSGQGHVSIMQDTVNGGYVFTGLSAGTDTVQALHNPSGHTANLPVTITNPVTSIGFATAT